MWLLREHHGPLTADFYRYYGDSPRRLSSRGVPLSDLADMAVHLPHDSATWLAVNPDVMWGLQEQLLAFVADLLNVANWQRSAGSVPRPAQIPRPGIGDYGKPKRGRRQLTPDEIDARLGYSIRDPR